LDVSLIAPRLQGLRQNYATIRRHSRPTLNRRAILTAARRMVLGLNYFHHAESWREHGRE